MKDARFPFPFDPDRDAVRAGDDATSDDVPAGHGLCRPGADGVPTLGAGVVRPRAQKMA